MNINQLYQTISNFFGVDVEEIELDSDFYEDFNAEQTAFIEFKLHIEDLIGTKIEEKDWENISTVEDLINLIEEYSNEYID